MEEQRAQVGLVCTGLRGGGGLAGGVGAELTCAFRGKEMDAGGRSRKS